MNHYLNIELYKSIFSGISSKNIYVCGDGRVLLDNFSNCISMISSADGKIQKQIYDYTDKLKDQLLYLAPEVIYQVCFEIQKNIPRICFRS